MMTPQSIAHVNNVAVDCMQQRRNTDAIPILCQTLKAILKDESHTRPTFLFTNCQELPTTIQLTGESRMTSIFNRAFMVQSDCCALTTEVTVCILLFNAGLACHRESLQTASSEMEVNAMSLYMEAMKRFEHYQLNQIPNAISVTLLAAIYHNLSTLHATVFDIHEARAVRIRLAFLLENFTTISLMDESDFTFFSVSLFCAASDDFQKAPAA